MNRVLHDLRHGWRLLERNRGFTAVAVLTLGLGIGANTAIFSLVDTVLLRPLPYRQPDRLVLISESLPKMGTGEIGVSAAEYQDYRSQNRSFAEMAAYEDEGFNLTGANQPMRVNAARVSASAFPLLGTSPELGRSFTQEEDRHGADKVTILSHALWERAYACDPNILGKTVRLDEQPYTVVGVMRNSFRFPFDGAPLAERPDLWVPEAFDPARLAPDNRINEFGVGAVARLKPGVTLPEAQNDVQSIASQFMQRYGYSGNLRVVPRVYRFAPHMTEKARPLLLLLMLAVASVLLIACANVANMLLARAAHRSHEMAIRTAVGANRMRILEQCLLESGLLSVGGAVVGILIAEVLIRGVVRFGPADVPRLHEASLHPVALTFTLALSLLSALGFGIVPAWRLSRTAPVHALRQSGSVGPSPGKRKLEHSVALFEVASAVVLLLSGGLLMKSFVRLLHSPFGFNPEGAFVVRTIFDHARYPDAGRRIAVQKQLLDVLRHLPGATAVAEASHLPLSDSRQIGFRLENAAADDFHWAENSLISPGYFRAMGIALLEGRDFTEQDSRDSMKVAVISESLAKQYYPGQDPIGRRFHWGDRGLFTIIGVAGDVHISALDADPPPTIYQSMFQVESGASGRTAFILRARTESQGWFDAVQRQVWSVDKDLPVYQSTTLTALVSESVAQRRFTVLLLGAFAVLSLLLAAIGLFGVISYVVAERTREFGIRMALGADRAKIYSLVLSRATGLSLGGCVLGLVISRFAARALRSSLYQVSSFDPATVLLVLFLVLGVALSAAYWPARRAAKVDPMVALRYE
jgi:predicted permease